ncbi:DUF3969 family protein [Xenorhabdus sp. XENO-10]|uniref:DUF3969 family protein n=1 Tax=Xenorhabdus yunnanensis TaxID=3025878 RepID=A0ABT5LME8_9GAMM|nr:DUF3969 family protein [Xenorhabdus yunnanensis]MDC9591643.1 DUF3969 family protein [Xenorhabdus yunnanensis]
MDFYYRIEDKHAGKLVSFIILGVLYSLERELISTEEADGFIFAPYVSQTLEELKADDECVDVKTLAKIIIAGCELDDVRRICPEFLTQSIQELIERTFSVIEKGKAIGYLVQNEVNTIERKSKLRDQ